MLNFDNLETVEQANSRINYDLRFSAKTGKFTLSQDAYTTYDINNNGFLLQKDGDTPVLQVVPNEESNMHSGKSGASQKGKTFTASGLAAMLGVEEGEASVEYEFNEHQHNGNTFLTMEELSRSEIEDSDDEDDIIANEEEQDVEAITSDEDASEETPEWAQ